MGWLGAGKYQGGAPTVCCWPALCVGKRGSSRQSTLTRPGDLSSADEASEAQAWGQPGRQRFGERLFLHMPLTGLGNR